jgi:hypothetical protein
VQKPLQLPTNPPTNLQQPLRMLTNPSTNLQQLLEWMNDSFSSSSSI